MALLKNNQATLVWQPGTGSKVHCHVKKKQDAGSLYGLLPVGGEVRIFIFKYRHKSFGRTPNTLDRTGCLGTFFFFFILFILYYYWWSGV
jgi:hypothetical protein